MTRLPGKPKRRPVKKKKVPPRTEEGRSFELRFEDLVGDVLALFDRVEGLLSRIQKLEGPIDEEDDGGLWQIRQREEIFEVFNADEENVCFRCFNYAEAEKLQDHLLDLDNPKLYY